MRIAGLCCGIDCDSTSGGEVHERELQIALKPHADTDILLARGKCYPTELSWRIVPTWPAKGQRWPIMATAGAAQLLRWSRLMRPDILRAHSILGPGLAALAVRHVTGIPVVAHLHHVDPDDRWWPLKRKILQSADVVTVLSDFSACQLYELAGVKGIKVGAGVRMPHETGHRKQRARLPVVLFLGELKARKRVDRLIRAWPAVLAERPQAQCWIVGAGPESERLEALAKSMNLLGSVFFVGRVPEVYKARYYEAAWTFVFPSELEGFGMPILEAQSYGLSVVSSDAPALQELPGRWLVDRTAAPETWAASIVKSLDPSEQEHAEQIGPTLAARYSWDHVARRTLAACTLRRP